MKKIIVDNYEKFRGKLQVTLKVPENVKNYIEISMESTCGSTEEGGDHEIICKNVTTVEWQKFSLKIKLKHEVCDPGLRSFEIEVSVFGQTDSTLPITVGEILCDTY